MMKDSKSGARPQADQATQAPPEAPEGSSPYGECPSRKEMAERTIILIIDANYHTAISKARSTAKQIVNALEVFEELERLQVLYGRLVAAVDADAKAKQP